MDRRTDDLSRWVQSQTHGILYPEARRLRSGIGHELECCALLAYMSDMSARILQAKWPKKRLGDSEATASDIAAPFPRLIYNLLPQLRGSCCGNASSLEEQRRSRRIHRTLSTRLPSSGFRCDHHLRLDRYGRTLRCCARHLSDTTHARYATRMRAGRDCVTM